MFDIGFGKLALIAVVALLVLGPERLPRVARTAGALIRRARNSWASVRAEIEREIATDDLKRSIREVADAVDIRADVNAAANSIHEGVRKPMADAKPASASESESSESAAARADSAEPSETAATAASSESEPHERR